MTETYAWCFQCEKANPMSRWEENGNRCPSCGAASNHMWSWSQIRSTDPNHPEIPEAGVSYPRRAQGAR